MAALVGASVIALAPTPASACSFVFPKDIAVVGSPEAGGTLRIVGRGFVAIDGEVSASCGGDFDFVPAPPVTVVVAFTTLSGPRSIALTAPVTGPRTPREEAEPLLQASYTIDVTTPIPLDATAVTVRVEFEEVDATISGAVATTVPPAPTTPAAPSVPAAATPATAVAGSPSFTG